MKRILFLLLILSAMGVGYAQSFEPKWVGEVVVLNCENDTVSIPTEKANVQVKTAASASKIITGIGNVRRKISIKGGRSTTQIPADAPIYLIVKCKDNETDPSTFIKIVKFEEKKKDRRAELASQNWIGSVSEGNMTFVPYEAETYGTSSYLLKMEPIEGEFGVRVLNPNDKDEKVPMFYCFGVHAE